jgi:hypothetical protein
MPLQTATKAKLLVLIIPMFIGCASNQAAAPSAVPQKSLDHIKCPSGYFRGSGIGENRKEAMNLARKELAEQVDLSIKVSVKQITAQMVLGGNETLNSKYEATVSTESALSNIHKASVFHTEQRENGETAIVICMSCADAAEGYAERKRLIADSLELLSNVAINIEHPQRKNNAWRISQRLKVESVKLQNLFKGWGIEQPSYSALADETFLKIKDYYNDYCKSQKIYWTEDRISDCSNISFSEISKRITIEKSDCSKGLNLEFSCSEHCKSSSFGVECFYEPSLAIESCEDESYSLLRVEKPLVGSDLYSENKAKEKLINNLSRANFFAEWEKEIKGWMPECAE